MLTPDETEQENTFKPKHVSVYSIEQLFVKKRSKINKIRDLKREI